MGNFSLNEFKHAHPECANKKMEVINHPAYTIYKNEITKAEARKKLNIPKNKKVILVFGAVRKSEEFDLILNSFNRLNLKEKFLLISNLNISKPLPVTPTQRINKFINTKIEKAKYNFAKKIKMNYGYVKNDDVQTYMNASDILFIPRINLLNSGNLYLGFSFKKVVVGPDIGNISEVLKANNNPIFNSKDINSVITAIEQGLSMGEQQEENNYNYIMQHCQPSSIAHSYYQFFNSL
jgi:glycosyltransferase involved in cell wall biosynthesis